MYAPHSRAPGSPLQVEPLLLGEGVVDGEDDGVREADVEGPDESCGATEEEEAALQAAAAAAQGEQADAEISELSSFRTTSDE